MSKLEATEMIFTVLFINRRKNENNLQVKNRKKAN